MPRAQSIREPHCCIDCERAKVYQYGHDPIIGECDDGIRNVARFPVMCERFRQLKTIRCIENREKRIGFFPNK